MAENVSEKVVRLETQMANVTNEVAEVKSLVKEAILKIDNITSLQTEVANLKQDIIYLKKKLDRPTWITPTVVGIALSTVSSVVTFLVISFISSK